MFDTTRCSELNIRYHDKCGKFVKTYTCSWITKENIRVTALTFENFWEFIIADKKFSSGTINEKESFVDTIRKYPPSWLKILQLNLKIIDETDDSFDEFRSFISKETWLSV